MNTVALFAIAFVGRAGDAVTLTHGPKVRRSVTRGLRSVHSLTVTVVMKLFGCGGMITPAGPPPMLLVIVPPLRRSIVFDEHEAEATAHRRNCSIRNLIGRVRPSFTTTYTSFLSVATSEKPSGTPSSSTVTRYT